MWLNMVAREAENPKVLCSILNFDRFLGSIPTFDQLSYKEKSGKVLQGNAFLWLRPTYPGYYF